MTELDRYGYEVERVRPERPAPPPPLTRDELKAVVDAVVAYTKIPPDKTMVQVWAVQSELARWTAAEAIRAIHMWGMDRKQGEFLEPSDVTRSIRAARQDAAMREEAARLIATPADPVKAERLEELVTDLAQRMGWSDDPEDASGRRDALGRPCPHCQARPGQRCMRRSPSGPVWLADMHPSRREGAA